MRRIRYSRTRRCDHNMTVFWTALTAVHRIINSRKRRSSVSKKRKNKNWTSSARSKVYWRRLGTRRSWDSRRSMVTGTILMRSLGTWRVSRWDGSRRKVIGGTRRWRSGKSTWRGCTLRMKWRSSRRSRARMPTTMPFIRRSVRMRRREGTGRRLCWRIRKKRQVVKMMARLVSDNQAVLHLRPPWLPQLLYRILRSLIANTWSSQIIWSSSMKRRRRVKEFTSTTKGWMQSGESRRFLPHSSPSTFFIQLTNRKNKFGMLQVE